MRKITNRISIAVAVITSGLVAHSALAAGTDLTWTGASGDLWSDASKWTINSGADTTPLAGDIARVNSAGGIVLNGAQSFGSLQFGGAAGTIDIGNGVLTDFLTLDNTGGVANSDTNSNASILSAGTATNVVSAPVRYIGGTTLQILQAGTRSLNLSGGLRLDSTATGATGASVLANNLTDASVLDIGDITSISTVTPAAGITNSIRLGNANNSTTTNWGTINLNGVISNGAPVGGFSVNTSVIYGAGGGNNTNNTIGTIYVKNSNTYSGASSLFRANIILGSDTAFGSGTINSAGGFGGNLTGANLISDNDARTLTNNMTMARNVSFKGNHSLTMATVNGFVSSNTLQLFNMVDANKTVTLGTATSFISTATTDSGRLLTVDGSGTTIFAGKVINNLGGTSLTVAPTDAGTDGRINKAGLGILKLTNSTNSFHAYATASGGILQFSNVGAASDAWMAVNPGGAIGVDTGSLAVVPARIAAGQSGFQVNRGSIALATADATSAIDYVTDPSLSHPLNAQVSIGALPGGVTYTGTITPAANTYRLGGGATLTLPNNNALTNAAGPVTQSLIVTNGGTVALTGTNNYTGTTIIEGNYIQSMEDLALANQQFNTIALTSPVAQGVYQKSTLAVSKIADGASSLGNAGSAASNLSINGGVLKYTGTGESTTRLFTIGTVGTTLDASGTGAVNFSNTGAIASAEAPTNVTGTTGTNSVVSAVNDISNLTVGMTVTGLNIPVGTTIRGFRPVVAESGNIAAGLNFQYNIYLSANGTAVGAAVPLTFGAANRVLSLTGSNTGDNTLAGTLSDAATGQLGIAKTGAGKWILSGNNTYTGATTVNAGTLALGHVNALGATSGTTVKNGATLAIATPSASAVKIDNAKLTRESGSKVDLLQGKLVLDYTGASPLATVKADIISGYAAGAFTGTGITTSDSVGGKKLRVGYAEASQLTLGGTYFGQTVDADAIILAGTFAGDADLNGTVNFDDLLKLAQNYGGTGKEWFQGDTDYNGLVDFDDLLSLAQSYSSSLLAVDMSSFDSSFSADWALALSVVPEPVSLSGVMALGVLAGRRRRA